MRGGSFAVRKAIRFHGRMAFLRLENFFDIFEVNTVKSNRPRCYLLWKDSNSPAGKRKGEDEKAFPKFFQEISGKASKTKNLRSHYS
ncbi:MAG: hypothetical protein J6N22_05685 [Schwartzia sp.]|nr:hypothetical protein [Schwartzia sp. (in: firmicutes)]